jgi:hypothetical protein
VQSCIRRREQKNQQYSNREVKMKSRKRKMIRKGKMMRGRKRGTMRK